jgi:hypothetical protein
VHREHGYFYPSSEVLFRIPKPFSVFMTEPSSNPESPESFSSSSPADETTGFEENAETPPWDTEEPTFGEDMDGSVATDMARLWVKRHQKAVMLGAFGVGVFVGALLRD